MKAIMITVRLCWFYLTYKGIKKAEIRKRFAKDFKGKIYECVSKTNWKQDLMKIPEEEREFFKQFVGKVGLCFECDKVEELYPRYLVHHYIEENNTGWCNLSERDLPIVKKWEMVAKKSCLSIYDLKQYLDIENNNGKAIYINKLEPFDKPKEISEFIICLEKKHKCRQKFSDYPCKKCVSMNLLTRVPQSWCYVEV